MISPTDYEILDMLKKAIMRGLALKFIEVFIINPEYYGEWKLSKEMYPPETKDCGDELLS